MKPVEKLRRRVAVPSCEFAVRLIEEARRAGAPGEEPIPSRKNGWKTDVGLGMAGSGLPRLLAV